MDRISYDDINEIYAQTIEAMFQQNINAQAHEILRSFPVNPIEIVRCVEAVYGLTVYFKPRDFYDGNEDIPVERRDLFAFHENSPGAVVVYLNKNVTAAGEPLLGNETRRFVILKEVFTSVLRHEFKRLGRHYPDTVEFHEIVAANLDWIVEKPSIFDIGGDDDSPTVSIENAAEILALLFMVDVGRLFDARQSVLTRANEVLVKSLSGEETDDERKIKEKAAADIEFSLIDYEKIAEDYEVNVRFVVVLIRSEFIEKFVATMSKTYKNIRDLLFSNGD